MKHGDFTELAKFYVNRPGYSLEVLKMIRDRVICESKAEDIMIADVGAGTGKLTENLASLGLKGYAVEPNDAMREEGIRAFADQDNFQWRKGTAELTNLPDECVNWVLMGSSFHWTKADEAMKEFYRIIKPGGFFTAIWNPRDIESSPLHMEIEKRVYAEIEGEVKRVSSGNSMTNEDMQEKMCGTDLFQNMVYIEAAHTEIMTKERYMNIWRSVNDIRVQAGEEGFQRILKNIEDVLERMDEIIVPYRSRSWTVQVKK